MLQTLITNYVTEVRNKIALKMIPNKTEEQILYLNFKYCDLSNSGHCNLRDFIKANDRIGVVMPNIKDLETVFHFFDQKDAGSIEYRGFTKDLFKLNLKDIAKEASTANPTTSCQMGKDRNNTTGLNFIGRLEALLSATGGNIALITFAKELQLIDTSSSMRLSLDDFLRVCADCKLKLTNEDVQLLFHSFDLFNNGIFHYTEVLRQLKNLYWDEEREKIANDLFLGLVDAHKGITIDQFKRIYKGSDREQFSYFIDSFKYIMKYTGGALPLRTKDVMEFVKYYGYGRESNEELNQILFDAFLNPETNPNQVSYTMIKKGNVNSKGNEINEEEEAILKMRLKRNLVFDKLKQALSKMGRKTLFNFIKHFKYYDNGTKFISKYDYVKVLKDFNIHLPIIEIENLYEEFSTDKNKMSLNYDVFIKDLIASSSNEMREEAIEEAYDVIEAYADSIKQEVSIDLLKGLFNPKDANIKGKEDNEVLLEFNESLEMFLFGYKANRVAQVSREDFIQFYLFASFLIYSDEEMIEMMKREWSKCYRALKENNTNGEAVKEASGQYQPQPQLQNNKRSIIPCQCPHEPEKQRNQQENTMPIEQNKDTNTSSLKQTKTTYNQSKQNLLNRPRTPISKEDPLKKLKQILRSRGLRGLIYLHKQFLISCHDLNIVSLESFIKVLQIQHINLPQADYQAIYLLLSIQEGIKGQFKFHQFIRAFKRELTEPRLVAVEKAFAGLDIDQTEQIPIDDIKLKYNTSQHPDFLSNKRTEDDLALEFIDCLEQNYSLLGSDDNINEGYMSFEMFANFYEYVSFLYDNDHDFEMLLESTWNLCQ